MKKIFAMMLLLAWVPAWGQVSIPDSNQRVVPADSVAVDDDDDDGPNVIGARPSPRRQQGEPNVLGTPIYYNLDGTVRDGAGRQRQGGRPSMPSDAMRRPVMPKHHYLNNLGVRFNSVFLESEVLVGHDLALGANLTYLPERWGAYGSLLFGVNHDYCSVGPVVRLSNMESAMDWHLYAGLTFGHRVGGEMGFRIASPSRGGKFCWSSASIGMAVVDGHSFLTVGLSLELAALTGLTLLLW